MITNFKIHSDYKENALLIKNYVENFSNQGKPYGNQDRNTLKLFEFDKEIINIKAFKVPNLINQIAYRFFRKSKAQRSYEYANKLIQLGIKTPTPIAYYEYLTPLLFKKSFYVSKQQDCEFTYRELTTHFDIPNHETILRAFTRFTYNLHEKRVHFLDHSPGNTLIQIKDEDYEFYLVDLNRMEFKPIDFETRIKNFSKLTTHKFMVEIMSDEYAKCINETYSKVFNLMWKETEAFQNKYHRKRKLKKILKFWKY